ncbi:MAG: imidazole glycerol phosphate synthase subunit HisH [Firmicutes bacterium]|nr:imidazole glycerol phosphate synthase subunit HisH [Bacillota bacterium]
MIAIIDYGAGNLRSVQQALVKLGHYSEIIGDPGLLRYADALILPGVGAFGSAMESLGRATLIDEVVTFAESGRPVLGICLGMHLLFCSSQESPGVPGFSLIPGRVVKFALGGSEGADRRHKVPHMGWNQVFFRGEVSSAHGATVVERLWRGIPPGSWFYFAHSYYAEPDDSTVLAGETHYGVKFASAVASRNLVGVQFHPEKSGDAGLTLLDNFARMWR